MALPSESVPDRFRYINECCVGGDLVSAALLRALEARYGSIDSGEEDRGWFMRAKQDGLRLAVDVFADDYRVGRFKVRIATSRRRLPFRWKEMDTAVLEELRHLVHAELTAWVGLRPLVVHVD